MKTNLSNISVWRTSVFDYFWLFQANRPMSEMFDIFQATVGSNEKCSRKL